MSISISLLLSNLGDVNDLFGILLWFFFMPTRKTYVIMLIFLIYMCVHWRVEYNAFLE